MPTVNMSPSAGYSIPGSPEPGRRTLLGDAVRSRLVSAACLGVIVLAIMLPADGLGLPLCQFRRVTGLPCLGCGLTRSFIGLAHLDLSRAMAYHPFALVLFPLTLLLAALLPARSAVREKLAAWVDARAASMRWAVVLFVALFLLYGIGRLAFCVWWLNSGHSLPVDW